MPIHITKTYAQWGHQKRYPFKTFGKQLAISNAIRQARAIAISQLKKKK